MEDSTTIKIILIIASIIISGSYPLFGLYLKAQEKKFNRLFGKTDKLEEILPEIQTDIKWLKEGFERLQKKGE